MSNKFPADSDMVPVEGGILKWPYLTLAGIQENPALTVNMDF